MYSRESYHYKLPPHLVAKYPAPRGTSRMLVYDGQNTQHKKVCDLKDILPENSLVVINETQVFPCRLFGKKMTGGAVEIFFLQHEPLFSTDSGSVFPVFLKSGRKKRIGEMLSLPGSRWGKIIDQRESTFYLELSGENFSKYFDDNAVIPIPPYIRNGQAEESDKKDYQCVYAKKRGSVAAPTAGLHFTHDILKELNIAKVTLHVGNGTFAPVKTDDIREHNIHKERFFVSSEEHRKIKEHTGPIIAVGTTALRVLETLKRNPLLKDNTWHETQLFLYPGEKVQSVQGLLTNFHLPESTLLMLVSAFIGFDECRNLYKTAIEENYRFFSYGDCSLLLR